MTVRRSEPPLDLLELCPSDNLRVTLEIHAHVPAGIDDRTVRIVTANADSLNFSNHGFENE